MLRLLLLTENHPPGRGGMAQSCDRIVRALRGRGIVVDVAHLSRRHASLDIEQQHGGRLVLCPIGDDSGHALNLLWNALVAAGDPPTHVLAFGGQLPMLAAPVFAAWLQRPLVVLLRGNDFDAGVLSPRHGWVLRDALARAARVCVVSREQQSKVARLVPQAVVEWIPNSIDVDDWQLHDFDRQRADAWRRREVAPGRRVIGLFGHLKQKKGGVLLLDALMRSGVAERFHLLVVGEIEAAMQSPLAAVAAQAGVSCLPFVDRFELLHWYAACDLLAVPSHYDGMPNVVLEAGALGVPLLASTAGGMADVLNGNNALTFARGDVHDCRRTLQLAAELPSDELQALGARLKARVLDEFAPRHEVARYVEMLHACVDVPSAGAAVASTSNLPVGSVT